MASVLSQPGQEVRKWEATHQIPVHWVRGAFRASGFTQPVEQNWDSNWDWPHSLCLGESSGGS